MDVTNLTFLFYGYSAAWIIVTAFVLLLVRRGRPLSASARGLLKEIRDKFSVFAL